MISWNIGVELDGFEGELYFFLVFLVDACDSTFKVVELAVLGDLEALITTFFQLLPLFHVVECIGLDLIFLSSLQSVTHLQHLLKLLFRT